MTPPTTLDAMWRAFRALVRAEMAETRYHGLYDYVVTDASDTTVSARPVDASLGLPPVARIVTAGGLVGATARATSGARCVLAFLDGTPTKPIIISLDGPNERTAIDVTDRLTLADGGSGDGVIRQSDTVCLGYFLVDPTTNIIYRSPPELGPLLTVYVPWWKVTAAADVIWCASNPATPTVPPPPGTPGTAWNAAHISASSLVRCG